MNIRELISEGKTVDIPQMFADFLPIAMKVLNIDKLPKIELKKFIDDDEQPTFGRYINDIVTIQLGIANRHPVDILRTLAHELVHFRQHGQGQLGTHSGDTGSPEENEANEIAGIIMRNFNKSHPKYLSTRPVLYEGWSKKYKSSINCNNPKGFSQRAHCQGRKKEEDVNFGGQQVAGNAFEKFKDEFPNLSTVLYFIPGFGQKLMIADIASAVQMYNQALVKIEKEHPVQTIQAVQNKVGDNGEAWEPIDIASIKETNKLIPYPKGTVKVDVSDVYDWYKLGQHISNLKGLGKHDFGKGPPQTILSFGSEPLEHEYLKYLKKIGLDTHDIDENFADGKNPGRKGLAKRSGVNCKASVSTLRNVAKNSSGEKQRMAHWCANMKSGRKK